MKPSSIKRELSSYTDGLPRIFWVIWVGTLINRLGAFVSPFLAIYLTSEAELSITLAGVAITLLGLGSFLARPLSGWMTDQVGRKPTLLTSFIGVTIFMSLFPLAQNIYVILLLTFPLGFFSDGYRPAVQAMVADLVPDDNRAQAFGMLYWAVNVGFAAAAVLAGYLAELDFRILFYGDAITSAIFGLIIWRIVPETKPELPVDEDGAVERPKPFDTFRNFRVPLKDNRFVFLVSLNVVYAIIYQQAFTTLPIYMKLEGFSEADYGTVIAVNGIVIILVTLPLTKWLNKFDPINVLMVSSLLLGFGYFLNIFANSMVFFAMTVVIWTLGELLASPIKSTLIANIAPPDLRGIYMGTFSMSYSVGRLTPILSTAVLDYFGGTTLWMAVFVMSIGSSVAYYYYGRNLRREKQQTEMIAAYGD